MPLPQGPAGNAAGSGRVPQGRSLSRATDTRKSLLVLLLGVFIQSRYFHTLLNTPDVNADRVTEVAGEVLGELGCFGVRHVPFPCEQAAHRRLDGKRIMGQ